MKSTFVSVGVLALFGVVLASPASAQMCSPGQQIQASTPAQSGGMCGMGQAAADDPMADKPAQSEKTSGMCPCCKNMAMMRGGTGSSMQHHNMPGMEMPKH